MRDRYLVVTPVSSVQPLVAAYEDGDWILWQAKPQAFVFNAALEDEQTNSQIQQWAYFNYLIYHQVACAAGDAPLSFADYPSSPVPHASDRDILWIVLVVMWIML